MFQPRKLIQKIGRNVLIGFGISFIVLIFIGIYSFRNLDRLKSSAEDISAPSELLVSLQSVIADFSNIEHGVFAYMNTKDEQYLSAYNDYKDSIDPQLAKIDSLSTEIGAYETETDSLLELFSTKKEIINLLMESGRGYTDKELYDSITKGILEVGNAKQESGWINGQKNNLFHRLWNVVKGDSIDETLAEDSLNQQYVAVDTTLDIINEAYDSFKKNLDNTNQLLSYLYEKNFIIAHEIDKIANNILEEEILSQEKRKQNARVIARKSIAILALIISFNLILIVVFLLLIFRDIYRTKTYQSELITARREAEQASVLKSNFLATMSHEIRTPLTTIIGFNDLLAKSELTEEQRNHISIVESASNHLLKVIDKILMLSKIQAGQIKPEKKQFYLTELVNSIYASLNFNARSKGINFFFRYEFDDLYVAGDYLHSRQILMNIISNAIKFTSIGSVGVYCRYSQTAGDMIIMEFLIRDSGVGIPQDKINEIFTEFNQLDFTSTRKYGGTGLGLTISQRLAELLGGSIKVKSTPGKGSTFIVSLPFERITEDVKETRPKAPRNMQLLKNLSALIVDDEEINATLSQRVLTNLEVDADMVLMPAAAIEKFKEKRYDVVLLDIHMPEISGYEVAQAMRKWELENNFDETIIIAFTADVMQNDIEKYTRFGISGYIEKPFKVKEIYNVLCYHLGLNDDFRDQQWSPATIIPIDSDEEKKSFEESYNLEELKKATGGDQKFFIKMLTTFVENAEAGNQNLQDAINTQDWKKAGEEAHRLKTMHRHLQMYNLAKMYLQIEDAALKVKEYEKIEPVLKKLSPVSEKIIASLKLELNEAKAMS